MTPERLPLLAAIGLMLFVAVALVLAHVDELCRQQSLDDWRWPDNDSSRMGRGLTGD